MALSFTKLFKKEQSTETSSAALKQATMKPVSKASPAAPTKLDHNAEDVCCGHCQGKR